MDSIKEAFLKVKRDIFYIERELAETKLDMQKLREELSKTNTNIDKLTKIFQKINNQTDRQIIQTNQTHNQTHTKNQTDDLPLYSLKRQNITVSTGNRGVQTDRQTDNQTDRHIIKRTFDSINQQLNSQPTNQRNNTNNLYRATEILTSLDNLKKEIRLKFKRLTHKEMLIFSLIYQLEEEGHIIDYKTLSSRSSLSESSIRDHVQKIISKGISIQKERLNNKKIILHISPDLKRIASLETIMHLREL